MLCKSEINKTILRQKIPNILMKTRTIITSKHKQHENIDANVKSTLRVCCIYTIIIQMAIFIPDTKKKLKANKIASVGLAAKLHLAV